MPTVRFGRADGEPDIQRINGTTVSWRDKMFETPAADVGMASFSNFPAIEFAVVTSRAATNAAGTPPVARVLI